MSLARTYHVGNSGVVRKLINLTDPWIDIPIHTSLSGVENTNLLDVKTSPSDYNKVFVVGETTTGRYGIYYSLDGGLTWTMPGGNYSTIAVRNHTWYEISVVDDNHIYVCGDNGWVCRSNDGGQNFTLCTQIPNLHPSYGASAIILSAKSLHFVNENVGVVGLLNNVVGTLDAGNNWILCCGGNGIEENIGTVPNPGYITGVHFCPQTHTIIAQGTQHVMRSTNTGTTFVSCYDWVGQSNGLHLTWQGDNKLWVFGANNESARTIDAGATWTGISVYNQYGKQRRAGHFYNGDNGFFSGSEYLYATSNGGAGYSPSDTSTQYINAVWTYFIESVCYDLTDCDGEVAVITVSNDLSTHVGEIVRLCDIDTIPVPPQTKGDSVTHPGYYILKDCCSLMPDQHVIASLGPYQQITVVIPSLGTTCWTVESEKPTSTSYNLDITGIVTYETCDICTRHNPCVAPVDFTGCKCFTISVATSCLGSLYLEELETADFFATCELCDTQFYQLENCEDPSEVIITYDDMSQYLGQVVQLERCPDKCWSVTETVVTENAECVTPVIQAYDTCEECLPQEEVIPETLNQREVAPGYSTGNCDPAYVENVYSKYADAAYKDMLSARYGVTTCCNYDVVKWEIKKQLLDLGFLYDSGLCSDE